MFFGSNEARSRLSIFPLAHPRLKTTSDMNSRSHLENTVGRFRGASGDNSPLSEWIAKVVVITVLLMTERILAVLVREAKAP